MTSIGRYEIVRHLATGGMAEVYLARMGGVAGFQKTLVVKRLLPTLASDLTFVDMLLDEARLAAQLNHPHIVQVYDAGVADGQYFIAMEYVDGPTAARLVEAAHALHLRIPIADALHIVSSVLAALSYAHAKTDERGHRLDIIHRDVTPENVFLTRDGTAKLGDFGVARAANRAQSDTQAGGFKGKLHYIAPEILRRERFDARADLFSVGVVLYQLLSGRRPFDGSSSAAIVIAVANDVARPLALLRPKVPALVQKIVERALSKAPDDRYPSASAMLKDVHRAERELGATGALELAELVATLCPEEAPPVADDRRGGASPLGSRSASRRKLSVEEIPIQSVSDPSQRKTQPLESVPDALLPASSARPTEKFAALHFPEPRPLDDDDEPIGIAKTRPPRLKPPSK